MTQKRHRGPFPCHIERWPAETWDRFREWWTRQVHESNERRAGIKWYHRQCRDRANVGRFI